MSGVAGGNRIKKQHVQATFQDYIDVVLTKVPGFKQASLSGSVKLGTKPDYGDLDLVVWFEGDDKREVKQRLISVINSLPTSVMVPFKSEKYAGKRYHNAGELISVLFPITGLKDEYIQVDNIIALTQEEQEFKTSFLDLPAEKQGVLIGLAKVILLEQPPQQVFKQLGIKTLPALEDNQEFEFNLSSVKLTLRKVTLDGFREVAREEVWSTADWNTIRELFKGFNIDGTFEDLLQDLVRKLKNPRSKQRVKGIFQSMVSVKSGEVGTPKAAGKEQALAKVASMLEQTQGEVVGLYGGGFKPPHKAHFANAQKLAQQVDRLIIFIGPKIREGLQITAQQAKDIWDVYGKYLPVPVEINISQVTPIRDIYEWSEANQDSVARIITGTTAEDLGRFKAFLKDRVKYPKVEVQELPVVATDEESKLSATNIRHSQEYLESGEWLPDQLNDRDIKKIVNILLPVLENVDNVFKLSEFFTTFYQATEGFLEEEKQVVTDEPQLQPPVVKTPALNLEQLRERISNQIGEVYYDVTVEGQHIKVSPKGLEEHTFDYTTYLTSVLEYAIQTGRLKKSLPEIKIKQDREEASNFFGRTAYYSPANKEIVLYTLNRHPKDVVRSFCHELIHHLQNEEGRLHTVTTTDTNEDGRLMELEKEAYLEGNMLFRTWEDKVKQQDVLKFR